MSLLTKFFNLFGWKRKPWFETFPDVEAIVATAIRNTGVRSYSGIPKQPLYPLVTVQRIGGLPAERHRLDHAYVQVDAWGDSQEEARDMAEEARRTLHALEGTTATAPDDVSGFITAVEDYLPLTPLPDNVTGRDRYLFAVGIYLHK